MATFEENLAIIRGGSNTGTVVRTAIADAMLQSTEGVDAKVTATRAYVDNAVSVAQTDMTGIANGAKEEMDAAASSAVSDIQSRVDGIQIRVDATLRMDVTKVSGTENDYLLTFINAT